MHPCKPCYLWRFSTIPMVWTTRLCPALSPHPHSQRSVDIGTISYHVTIINKASLYEIQNPCSSYKASPIFPIPLVPNTLHYCLKSKTWNYGHIGLLSLPHLLSAPHHLIGLQLFSIHRPEYLLDPLSLFYPDALAPGLTSTYLLYPLPGNLKYSNRLLEFLKEKKCFLLVSPALPKLEDLMMWILTKYLSHSLGSAPKAWSSSYNSLSGQSQFHPKLHPAHTVCFAYL